MCILVCRYCKGEKKWPKACEETTMEPSKPESPLKLQKGYFNAQGLPFNNIKPLYMSLDGVFLTASVKMIINHDMLPLLSGC